MDLLRVAQLLQLAIDAAVYFLLPPSEQRAFPLRVRGVVLDVDLLRFNIRHAKSNLLDVEEIKRKRR